jgi:hypothetical protein
MAMAGMMEPSPKTETSVVTKIGLNMVFAIGTTIDSETGLAVDIATGEGTRICKSRYSKAKSSGTINTERRVVDLIQKE